MAKDKEKKVIKPKKNKGEKKKMRLWKKLLIFVSLILVLSIGFLGVAYAFSLNTLQSFDPDKITNVRQSLIMYDMNGAQITRLYAKENRLKIKLSNVPKRVINAFLSAENNRFYEHFGLDIQRIFGALIADIKSGSISQGASTITQQLIKLSHLTPEKTWIRKLQEGVMAFQLEKQYSKDEILEMYLNYIYFGNGAYGIEAASQVYFGKSVDKLTIAEAALLAGVIKSPTNYAPHIEPENSVRRRNLVVDQMLKFGYISGEEAAAAKAEKLKLAPDKTDDYPHGYFADEVLVEAAAKLDMSIEEIMTAGLRVYTTMDPGLQELCESSAANDSLYPEKAADGTAPETAIVISDVKTNEVRALVGGRKYYTRRGFDRATQLFRQPGSTIKPVLVYAPAVEYKGYTPATMVLDEQESFDDYVPSNFSDKYNGWVPLRQAVAKSLNMPALKLLRDIGIDNAKRFARSVGIEFEKNDNNISLALGGFTKGVSPLQLSSAYVSFANGGMYSTPEFISRITNSDGKVLYEHPTEQKRVMSQESAYIITDMLKSVVDYGTAQKLSALGIPLAGKTGTTSFKNDKNNKDIWMVAFNPEYSCSVWIGYDETSKEHSFPPDATGGSYPAKIVGSIFSGIYPDKSKAPEFSKPDGIVDIKLDRKTLEDDKRVALANAFTPPEYVYSEIFDENNIPNENSKYWSLPEPPDDLTVFAGQAGLPDITFTPKDKNILYRLIRKSEGQSTIIGEFHGSTEKATVFDSTAERSKTYYYSVIPVNLDVNIDGKALEGMESKSIMFTVQSLDALPTFVDGIFTEQGSMPTPEPTPFVLPSALPSPQPSTTLYQTGFPSPTATPSATQILTPSPSPSSTPTPKATPSPSASPVNPALPTLFPSVKERMQKVVAN